jgi:regulator of protease activity HflC (stomatin/prohibitin superfamily)
MRRAMSKQAEAEREKRAKIIHAEGEYQAAEKLVSAAREIATEPVAIQLRYLQTLTEIGVEQNTTVVFPIPIQMIEGLSGLLNKEKVELPVARSREPVAVSHNDSN